ncbi:DUF5518 domain-containing protein [Halomarina litorea]|uniref:DUF5518 domain-containing protein n=1 Tax=Halomarina litorea TaxID=2961595 RepID=UPI0020C48ADD|nr:DUF5518 domain-containing protein [Halomarina sp. BCD28]
MTETTGTQTATGPRGGLLLHALVGAVVMFLLSLLPLSPVLGGAAAGYLHRRDGLTVGALAGLVATLPVVAVVTFVASLLLIVPEGGVVGALVGLGALGVVLLVVVGLYTAGLGALGGYLGVLLFERRARDPPATRY